MTDIVERLRQGVDTSEPPDKTDRVMWEAAAEIERLREELRVVLMHVADLRGLPNDKALSNDKP